MKETFLRYCYKRFLNLVGLLKEHVQVSSNTFGIYVGNFCDIFALFVLEFCKC